MSRSIARHVRSNVIGYIALFIALAGTAYAAQHAPRNSVVSKSIKNGAVRNRDLANDAVTGRKVLDGSLTGADINQATLTVPPSGPAGGGLAGTYPDPTIGANAVNGANIADGTVANADLAGNAVTSSKIADGTVANADLGTGSVGSGTISDGSITGADVQNRGLSDGDIGSPAQVNNADIPNVGANSCINLQLNFGGWTQVGELVIANARDGQLGASGLFITPLTVTTSGSADGRVCNVTGADINPAAEDVLAWSIRQ